MAWIPEFLCLWRNHRPTGCQKALEGDGCFFQNKLVNHDRDFHSLIIEKVLI